MIKNKRLVTLKDCFDKIKQRAVDNVLGKALQIPDTLRLRILKKFIHILKDKTDKLAKKRGADKIGKYF